MDEEQIAKLFCELIDILNEDEVREIDKILLKAQSRLLKKLSMRGR